MFGDTQPEVPAWHTEHLRRVEAGISIANLSPEELQQMIDDMLQDIRSGKYAELEARAGLTHRGDNDE